MTGGIVQNSAYLQTLQAGARSSTRHWRAKVDEFLIVMLGDGTVVENHGPHVPHFGDDMCWPAGVGNAHHVVNRSGQPCSYLIVGTRQTDVCLYSEVGKTLNTEGETWRVVDAEGPLLRSGRIDPDS